MFDRNPNCFACGAANPIGLGLRFSEEGGRVLAEFTPLPWHQGYDGVIHGGLLATMLDEAMAHALLARGLAGVTARMTVRYRAPVKVGERISIQGWITGNRGRLIETEAAIYTGERLSVEARGVFACRDDGKNSAIEGESAG